MASRISRQEAHEGEDNVNKVVNQNVDRELVSRIAMDIGKAVVSHIRTMYPQAYAAMPKSGHLSLRNCVYNEIMAAINVTDAIEIEERIKQRAFDRKTTHKIYEAVRRTGAA